MRANTCDAVAPTIPTNGCSYTRGVIESLGNSCCDAQGQSPSSPPSGLHIVDGKIAFGPNMECVIQLKNGVLDSNCPINAPASNDTSQGAMQLPGSVSVVTPTGSSRRRRRLSEPTSGAYATDLSLEFLQDRSSELMQRQFNEFHGWMKRLRNATLMAKPRFSS